ncbi:MAG: RDD family protein [Candidatus Acidiferrales bacterium]
MAFLTGTSAAQNGPVIRICSHCGALLFEDADTCSFCDASLGANDEELVPAGASVSAQAESEEPEWRREVARRLEDYRARRHRGHPGDPQSGLPFAITPTYEEEIRLREPSRPRANQRISPRQRPAERVEICIQPELDFANSPDDRARPQTALVPVAGIADRRTAGALDAIFLGLTYAAFLGVFRSLGGQIMLEKVDAAVYLVTIFLFYAQYFFLFTTFAGSTPGMQLRGLTIVRLDGTLPDTRQLLWRSFGYLLSGATLMAGFLWAVWDEDRFTWQDRISQTYITAASPVKDIPAFEVPAHRRGFAHK